MEEMGKGGRKREKLLCLISYILLGVLNNTPTGTTENSNTHKTIPFLQ